MDCPVVKTIKEIKGAGILPGDPDSNNNIAVIGSGDTSSDASSDTSDYHMVVCEDTMFYMMVQRLTLARIELTNDAALAQRMIDKMGPFPTTAGDLYCRVTDNMSGRMYRQFILTVDLLGAIETLLIDHVAELARKGAAINVSCPNITLAPHTDTIIKYDPDALACVVNKIIRYINSLNLSSILLNCKFDQIEPVQGITVVKPNMEVVIDVPRGDPISGLKKLIGYETMLCEYICEVEKYHCMVINRLNGIHKICNRIIEGLKL